MSPRFSKSASSLLTVIRVDPIAEARSSCVSGSGYPIFAISTRYFARRLATSRNARSSAFPSRLRIVRESLPNM